jgi:hypothetical protein
VCSGRPRQSGWFGERAENRNLGVAGSSAATRKDSLIQFSVGADGLKGEAVAAARRESTAARVLVTGLVRCAAQLVSQARTAVG